MAGYGKGNSGGDTPRIVEGEGADDYPDRTTSNKDDAVASAHAAFRDCVTGYGGIDPDHLGPNNPPIAPNRTTQARPNFIQRATANKGGLHRSLGVPLGQKIPAAKVAAAASRPGKIGKQARLAQTLGKLRPK